MRILIALLLSFISFQASAADYYWYTAGYINNTFSSPSEACQFYVQKAEENAAKSYPYHDTRLYAVRMDPGQSAAMCDIYYVYELNKSSWDYRHPLYPSEWTYSGVIAYRGGNACPPGKTFDPATGECKAPEEDKCAPTIGQYVTHQHNRGALSEGGVILQNTLKEPPGAVCDNSCQYAYSGEVPTSCYRFIGAGGDQNSAYCTYRYKGNGVKCQASDTAVAAPPADLSPKREKKNECTQKVTDAEGRTHYSCLASDKMEDPGNMQCGEVNGKFGCVAGKPSPQKTEKEVKTEVSETKASDGSSTTNTTTTNNTTNCTGVNACSTTTSVTNGTSKTNADGTSGGESSTCTGAGCKESTGEEEKEEEEEQKDEVTGDECGQPLSCSGDVIQCAVLKQQKQSRCDWNYQDAKPGIESEIAKPEYQVGEDSHDMSGLFSSAIGAARWLPSSCPAPERAGLRTRGAGSVQLSWQPTCDFASSMAPVIVAMASLFFALYVGRGIGGGA